MILNNKIYKLFCYMPITCIFGNNGDISRYKYLSFISDAFAFKSKESFLNKYIKDKINIAVYPKIYGNDIFLKKDNGFIKLDDIQKIVSFNASDIQALILPGKNDNQNCLYELPAVCEDFYFTFDDKNSEKRVVRIELIEGFPYGKESFIKLVENSIKLYPFNAVKKICLYKENIQYGATDITDINEALNSAVKELQHYTKDISIITDASAKEINNFKSNIGFQYKVFKSLFIQDRIEYFDTNYDFDYENNAEKFLKSSENKNAVLSETIFSEASDFKNVRNSNNVMEKIFQNYIFAVESDKKSVIDFIEKMYDEFLYDLDKPDYKYYEAIADNFIYRLKSDINYSYNIKKCPDSPIEYRKFINESNYIIKLKRYVNSKLEKYIDQIIYSDIKEILKNYKEKFL